MNHEELNSKVEAILDKQLEGASAEMKPVISALVSAWHASGEKEVKSESDQVKFIACCFISLTLAAIRPKTYHPPILLALTDLLYNLAAELSDIISMQVFLDKTKGSDKSGKS